MENQTLIIFAVLICLAPIVTLAGLAWFGKIMKSTKPARKRIKAEIAKNRIAAGNLHTYEVGKWIEVGEYNIIVHKVTEQHRIHNQKKERIIYIDVEYKNQTEAEELSCRRNQWYLYSDEGYKYEASSEMTALSLYHEKHYFGNEGTIKPGMNLRGWLAFILPDETKIRVLQFMTAFLGTKTAEFDIEGFIEVENSIEETKAETSVWYHLIEEEYVKIEQAAKDFLKELPNDNIKQAITLSAEMAGLKLLRAANLDLSEFKPGAIVLGAIPDEMYQYIQRFIISWFHSNGMDLSVSNRVELSEEDKKYHPEIVRLEETFDELCKQNNLILEHYSYAAMTAALKLVLAGKNMDLLDENTGRALLLYHIVSGSKIIPYSLD